MSMLRHNGLSASLLLAAFSASLAVLLVLELSNCLADVYFSQPVAVSSFSAEPRRTLLDGLTSSDTYIKRFAFIELRQLAVSDEKRRIDIFSDIKGKSYENISKACVVELGQSHRNLQGRGQQAAALPSSSASSAPQHTAPQSRTTHDAPERLAISNENAFRPTQRTFLDSIIQPGAPLPALPSVPVPPKAQEVLTKVKAAATSTLVKVPAIFQQKAEERLPAGVKDAAVTATQVVKKAEQSLLERLKGFTPENIKRTQYWKYLFEDLLRAQVDQCLPNPDLDYCAASCKYCTRFLRSVSRLISLFSSLVYQH
jgi:nucleoporin NDC1